MAAVIDSPHILLVCYHICPNSKPHNRFTTGSSHRSARVSFGSFPSKRQRSVSVAVTGREIADVRAGSVKQHTRSAIVEIPVTCYQIPVTRSAIVEIPVTCYQVIFLVIVEFLMRVLDNANNVQHSRLVIVEIRVTCYQILGIPDKSEKDEIVKSVKHLKMAEVEEGYTMDTIISRQNLLVDVRDKLLFEADYAGNMRDKVPPKSSLQIPWSWLPAALCLLQEVGEEKLAIDIGRTALQHPDSKPFVHDLLLSMALAECAIAKLNFEKNKISQGFEALDRAQTLLKSKPSLEQMTLLSQIEESLEELAPACTLELLGMAHTPENAERRTRAIAALQEMLRRGLEVESQSQIEDWSSFLNQALSKLTASEIVDLLTWDTLANTRKNKKSLESHNQRAIVDTSSFYTVMMAHLALGFSTKQIEMIKKAKAICECLVASDGVDLKLEEAFCLFLLGQGDEAVVIERLQQLESNFKATSRTLISGNDIKDKKFLESWVNNAVLGLFPDTRDCSPSVDNFFIGEKMISEKRNRKKSTQPSHGLNHRPISPPFSSDWRTREDYASSSRLGTTVGSTVGSTVKQLTPSDLLGPPPIANSLKTESYPSVQLKRNLGMRYDNVWDIWLGPNNVVRYMSVMTVVACLCYATFNVRFVGSRRASSWANGGPRVNTGSLSHVLWGSAFGTGNLIANSLRKLSKDKKKVNKAEGLEDSRSFTRSISMTVEEAENLVKKWQSIKAEALGPDYQVNNLVEVLDESMLLQWKGLAESAKEKNCFWRFVLLQLSVTRADILSDERGKEMAEIEAVVEEAAELVDDSYQKNPNYYSTYTIRYLLKRQDDGSWRFCEGDIQTHHDPNR
ncbi:plastid division protein CDP1, chloroplastic-like [Bidens hawaiensis]|uniref:plastid division protein CDP1, chloroplastic-like n=1 Tax=Bidens hawaiensis TaxID=980011 RepID=UPI0040495D21